MPTTRPRHTITESDELSRALDLAASRWPSESRSRLLLRLAEAGARTLEQEQAERVAAVRRTSGALTGSYPEGYLDRLRHDWPA